jgi:dihydrofolate reductase
MPGSHEKMKRLGLFLHTSLDGFVAGPKGEMDWITVDAETFDYTAALTDNADTYLMGRATYQMMEGYWPKAGEQPNASKHDIEHSKWYNGVRKVVISKTLYGQNLPNTTIIGKDLEQEVLELKKLPGKDIIMFGSPTAAHYLMRHDLIDEYGLFVNPVLLGHGIPMFQDIGEALNLKPSSARTFSSGVVCLRYQRNRS